MKRVAKAKSIIMATVAVATIVAVVVTGTLAYLTDVDDRVNVSTIGNVDIEQIELQRAEGIPHAHVATEGDLVSYMSEKISPAYAADITAYTPDVSAPFYWGKYVTEPGAANGLWNDQRLIGAKDHFVMVKNNGEGCYYRTVFAFECPEGMTYTETSDGSFALNLNRSSKFVWETVGYSEIEGTRYLLMVATYQEILQKGEISAPSLLQTAMTGKVTTVQMHSLGATYDVLSFTQAIQSDNLEGLTPSEAIRLEFADITPDNNPWAENITPEPPVESEPDAPEIISFDHYYSVNETGRLRARQHTIHAADVTCDSCGAYTCRQDDTIYYFGETSSYKMKLDGSGKTAINGITRQNMPFVIGDYIYYGTLSTYGMNTEHLYQSLSRTNIATGQTEKLFGGDVYDANAEFILHFTGWKGKLIFCTGTRYVGNPQGQLRFYSYDPTTEKLTMLKEHNPEISYVWTPPNYFYDIFMNYCNVYFYEGEFVISGDLYSAETGEMTYKMVDVGNPVVYNFKERDCQGTPNMLITADGLGFASVLLRGTHDNNYLWHDYSLNEYDLWTSYLYDYAADKCYRHGSESTAPDIVAYSEGVAYDSYPDGLIFKMDDSGIICKLKTTDQSVYQEY